MEQDTLVPKANFLEPNPRTCFSRGCISSSHVSSSTLSTTDLTTREFLDSMTHLLLQMDSHDTQLYEI